MTVITKRARAYHRTISRHARVHNRVEEIAGLDTVIGTPEQMSRNGGAVQKAHPYQGLRFGDAAQKALELAGTPRGTKQLVTALQTGGFKSQTKHPYRALYRALWRLSEQGGPVVKLKDGWALRKWQSRLSTPPARRAA